MTTVFSLSPLRQVHDINVATKNGRHFVIDIYAASAPQTFDATVTVYDRISPTPGSWLYQVPSSAQSPSEIFTHSIQLIHDYLSANDPTDVINKVANPCNDPFVSVFTQNLVLGNVGLPPMATK